MRFLSCSCGFLALLAFLVVAPSTHAGGCPFTTDFAAARQALEQAVPCASASNHTKYVNAAKKAVRSQLTGPCKKLFVKRFIKNSTCGRSGFEVCCQVNKKGKDVSKVVKIGKCKGQTCSETSPTSVGEGCTSNGTCAPPPTTSTTTTTLAGGGSSTSTTSTTTTSTTTTTCPDGICVQLNLEFTNGAFGGTCGDAKDGSNAVVKTLHCGGLNIGGGGSTVQEGPTPDGATNRFSLSCANLTSPCTVSATATPPAVNSTDADCTTTGCNFGTPLEIPNPNLPNLTTCVLNTFQSPASGTVDLTTGASSTNVALVSTTYLTGNLAEPCPRCRSGGVPVSGSQSSPATGTCDRGPRTGQPCTSTNSIGLTRDCQTGGANATHACMPVMGQDTCIDGTIVGPINVVLTPLTTGTASKSDPAGHFCPGQGGLPGTAGCFAQPTCRTITENGTPAGPITVGTPATATLASVFCIAATPNGTVNFAADLPGPGATSLPGTFLATNP